MCEDIPQEELHKLQFERGGQLSVMPSSNLPCFLRLQGGMVELTYYIDSESYVWRAPDKLIDLSPYEIPEVSPEHLSLIGRKPFFPQHSLAN